MSDLHPTTAALLLAARNAKDITTRLSEPPLYGPEVDDAVTAWKAAGCPDAPEPRFVPTEPGWYWRQGGGTVTYIVCVTFDPNGLQNRLAWTSGFSRIDVTDDGLWLGPVAPWSEAHPDPGPCPPKPRTAEEARANPMPGDRWQYDSEGWHYTLISRPPNGVRWNVRTGDGHPHTWLVGEAGETYLGHFPVDP